MLNHSTLLHTVPKLLWIEHLLCNLNCRSQFVYTKILYFLLVYCIVLCLWPQHNCIRPPLHTQLHNYTIPSHLFPGFHIDNYTIINSYTFGGFIIQHGAIRTRPTECKIVCICTVCPVAGFFSGWFCFAEKWFEERVGAGGFVALPPHTLYKPFSWHALLPSCQSLPPPPPQVNLLLFLQAL